MFPRDAGLLEGSTGRGLSLSLLVAAVEVHRRLWRCTPNPKEIKILKI